MKKYMLIGLLLGAVLSIFIFLSRRKGIKGTEFEDFLESTTIADDLFGNAFSELPDRL